jgi:hypothetical protein
MKKLAVKTLSFIIMVFVMYAITMWLFRSSWPIFGWVAAIFFGFTLLVFPYKSYFKSLNK